MKSNEIKRCTEKIRRFIKERDWEQFQDPKNIALSLVLEAAEVLELFQWTKDNDINPTKKDKLSEELADVFYWLLNLADKYDIDIIEAFDRKMEQNKLKYPIEKAKGKSNKYNEL